LHGLGIGFGRAVGLEIVAAVLERHSIFALEFFVVPFRDFGMSEKRVVSASEAGFHALGDVIVERQVCAERVGGVLPVAVLRLVDGLDNKRQL
jgi:hypothetical protein